MRPHKDNGDGTAQVKCERCRKEFTARIADLKRGWAKFCSKSCKAVVQTLNRAGRRRLTSNDPDELGVGELAGQWD